MPAPSTKAAGNGVPEPSCRTTSAQALTIVRDGVITGEGPTTKGRIHFSRTLDADDAAWCARILSAAAVEHEPVGRAEVEALFEIPTLLPSAPMAGASTTADQGGRPSRCGRSGSEGAAANGGVVSGYRNRELGAGECHQGEYRGAAMDRSANARQASQQSHPDGDGGEYHRCSRGAAGATAQHVRYRADVRSSNYSDFTAAGVTSPPLLLSLARARGCGRGSRRRRNSAGCRRAETSAPCAGRRPQGATSPCPRTLSGSRRSASPRS